MSSGSGSSSHEGAVLAQRLRNACTLELSDRMIICVAMLGINR
jgi:hypothetical protein